jgi:HAD superfamily hydrolase (TIGR01509 family)
MIQALIFDFDGLILDTETTDYLAWQEICASFSCELPLDRWHNGIGAVNLFDPCLFLEEQLGRSLDRAAIRAQHRRRNDELVAQNVVLPGVESYLADARRLGMKIGLASSSRHAWVDSHLARLGLLEQFDVICCRDDVGERSKPDPAVYQAALAGLAVEPQHALALEDSPNGAWAARRAGLFCVAVPNEMTRALNFDHAHYRLTSLADLRLEQLIAEVKAVIKRPQCIQEE